VAAYFVLMPKYNSYKDLKNQVNKREQTLSDRQKMQVDLKELEDNYSSAKMKVKDISNILPKEKQIPELLVQLEAIAKENSMTLASINVTPAAEEKGVNYKSLRISLGLAGSYSNLKKYLDSVERNMRIMDITSIDFSATPVVAQGPADVFSYTVNIKTYFIE
jgi:Tfp pilus assembly protein PilO